MVETRDELKDHVHGSLFAIIEVVIFGKKLVQTNCEHDKFKRVVYNMINFHSINVPF